MPVPLLIDGVHSPALAGLGRSARLLIPAPLWERLDPGQRDALIVHELAHYRRGDHWVRLLELLAVGLFWWFPVAWWARRSLREAEERCCDAWVVRALPGARHAYAAALIETLDFLAGTRPMPSPLASGLGGPAAVRARLDSIIRGGPAGRLSRRAALGLLATAAAVLPLAPPAWGEPRGWRIEAVGVGGAAAANTPAAEIAGKTYSYQQPGSGDLVRMPATLPRATYDLALGRDGTAVVAGVAPRGGAGGVREVIVTRHRVDGSPDPAFGAGGVAATGFVPNRSVAPIRDAYVAVQADNKVIIAAPGDEPDGGFSDVQLRRLNTDGTPDLTFGRGGLVSTNLGRFAGDTSERGTIDNVGGLAVQRDGKIVVAGTASSRMPGADCFAVARYGPDGQLDRAFGLDGRMRSENPEEAVRDFAGMVAPITDVARALALADDGRIVVAGTSNVNAGFGRRWKVAVLDSRGRPDVSFGVGGVVVLETDPPRPVPYSVSFVEGVVVQPDGKIVVAGGAALGPDGHEVVAARFDRRGHLDPTFGAGGIVRINCPVWLCDMALAPDGRLILAGGIQTEARDASCDLFLLALTPDGSPDEGFGRGGWLRASPTGGREEATRVRVRPDGDLVVAGYAAVDGLGTVPYVARFRPSVRPDRLLTAAGSGTLLMGLGLAASMAGGRRRDDRPPPSGEEV